MSDIGYSKELARIHHEAFGRLAEAAAEWIVSMFSPSTHPQVVDLGCGSGILARRLMKAGYSVTGIDISEDMIAIAREVTPEATFFQGSIYDFGIPDCDLVCMTGEVINYLFDDKSGTEALSSIFKRVHRSLRPGGIFVFDHLTPDIEPSNSSRQGQNWSLHVSSETDAEHMHLERKIGITVMANGKEQLTHEMHRVRLHRSERMFAMLTENGFTASAITGYGNYTFRKGHTGFICEKMHHQVPGAQPSWIT